MKVVSVVRFQLILKVEAELPVDEMQAVRRKGKSWLPVFGPELLQEAR